MPLEPAMLIAIAAVLTVGCLIQSAAGFGFALFTVPVLVLLGRPPWEAIILVAVGASGQAIVGLIVLREHIRWPRVLAMIALASAANPVGVAVLGMIIDTEPALVRRIFGGLLLVVLLVMFVLRVRPRERWPVGAMVGAMLASGFLGGLSGMSGPPAVLWVMAHRWSNPESRVTLWALFGGTMPVQLLLLRQRFGPPVDDAAVLALMLVPVTIIGLVPGLWIGRRIPKKHLRTISMALLVLIGAWALAQP